MSEDNQISREQILLKTLHKLRGDLDIAIELLEGSDVKLPKIKVEDFAGDNRGQIIEGVFAGDKMIGSDGKPYKVAPNYASKSKLIEGDIMKLTITPSGNFIYKQIGPAPRKRMTGELIVDPEQDEYWVASDLEKWCVLKASATFFKGRTGDKVVFLVPQDAPSKWAALEDVIRETEADL